MEIIGKHRYQLKSYGYTFMEIMDDIITNDFICAILFFFFLRKVIMIRAINRVAKCEAGFTISETLTGD